MLNHIILTGGKLYEFILTAINSKPKHLLNSEQQEQQTKHLFNGG